MYLVEVGHVVRFDETGAAGLNHTLDRAVEVALHGATITLVLISGTLYSHVFARRRLLDFYRSRAFQVVMPYVVVSLLLSTFTWLPGQAPQWLGSWTTGYARVVLGNLLVGSAEFHLWYVPVAVILFALSPLLHVLVATPGLAPAASLVAAAPLLISRTDLELTPSQVVYFAGPYLLGMLAGKDVAATRRFIGRSVGALGLVAGAATVALLVVWSREPQPPAPVSLPESLFYIQKVALSALMLHLCGGPLARLPARARSALDGIADRSLALYLLHVTILTPLWYVAASWHRPATRFPAWLATMLVVFSFGTLACFGLIDLVRRVVPRRSRLIIGA
jgi:peptidoglycan/LPS O-acetylase OafA/YrhL